MRLDLAPGKAAALEQALVLRQFQPRLEASFSGRRAASPPSSQAAISNRAIPRPRRLGATRHARDMERVVIQAPQRGRDERVRLEGPEPAARRDLGSRSMRAVSRRADDGGVVCRLCAAKAARMSVPPLRRPRSTGAQRSRQSSTGGGHAWGRRFGVIGERGIAKISMARRIRPSQGRKARAFRLTARIGKGRLRAASSGFDVASWNKHGVRLVERRAAASARKSAHRLMNEL